MPSKKWRILSLVLLVVVLALIGAFLLYSPKGETNTHPQAVRTAPLPGSPDVSFLGVISPEGRDIAGYVGEKNGTFTKLPPLPEGERLVALARGGTILAVLSKKEDTGENRIYRFIDGMYLKQFEGKSLSALTVSEDGKYIGFSQAGEKASHVFVLALDGKTPIDLGEGSKISFFVHEKTTGAWIVHGGLLLVSTLAEKGWEGGTTAYKSEKNIVSFASNGASRFAFEDPVGGGAEERVIKTLSPFEATQLASFAKGNYAGLFFKGTDFYTLAFGVGSATVTPIQRPAEALQYPVAQAIPGVTEVVILNP